MSEFKISVLIMRKNMSFSGDTYTASKNFTLTNTGNDFDHFCKNCFMIVLLVVMSRRFNNLRIFIHHDIIIVSGVPLVVSTTAL